MREAARRRRILRKAEERLIRAVAKDSPETVVRQAAEDVRAAMLSFLKGQRELILYKDQKTTSEFHHLANFEHKTTEWLSKSVDEIVGYCGSLEE